jgi:hypothetical protein
MTKPRTKKTKTPAHVHEAISTSKVVTHDLSVLKKPTHKHTNQLGDSTTEQKAVNFVFGFDFHEDVHTVGKKTHDDYAKTFGKAGK